MGSGLSSNNKDDALNSGHGGSTPRGIQCRPELDTRLKKSVARKPSLVTENLWEDKDFTTEEAMKGIKNQGELDWKRPHEFSHKPALFVDGMTRFDVGQGGVGDCWFLSVLAALAEKEEIIKQIIVDDYNIGNKSYRGKFHCRFWKFGEWVDVYIDDKLPLVAGTNTPWGAHSATDNNEMWPALLEKAFAKFNGSYSEAESGLCGDAFRTLTGGLAETITHKELSEQQIVTKISNALNSGCTVACTVNAASHDKNGLIGGHAYSLTKTVQLPTNRDTITLLRIRNPWGEAKGEWTGAWSDYSPLWKNIPSNIIEEYKVIARGDGEFWISASDYLEHFNETILCNFTPDFDQDGSQDDLDNCSVVFGEWVGDTAAGAANKFQNPRFFFTVPPDETNKECSLPVVIELSQKRANRKDKHLCFIKAFLFKIEAEGEVIKRQFLLHEETTEKDFWNKEYGLTAGKYLIIPSTHDAKTEKAFMIRIFSSISLAIEELPSAGGEKAAIFLRTFDMLENFKISSALSLKLEHFFGRFSEENCGSVYNNSFENNPQFTIKVTGPDTLVMLSLKQELSEDRKAIGILLHKIREDTTDNEDISPFDGQKVSPVSAQDIFMYADDASDMFLLPRGQYSAVLFVEKLKKSFCYLFTVGFLKDAEVEITEHRNT